MGSSIKLEQSRGGGAGSLLETSDSLAASGPSGLAICLLKLRLILPLQQGGRRDADDVSSFSLRHENCS